MRRPHLRPILHKVGPVAHHGEHVGFVALAGADVWQLGHGTLWVVALWLLVTGLPATLNELFPCKECLA